MVTKGVVFEEVHDLIAFRVIVGSLSQCYESLGQIHSLWKPVPRKFKDYIAMPKPNGYRSLHTTIVTCRGERIELQIRTKEMHKIAEEGIAAHWVYKEKEPVAINTRGKRSFLWFKQMMNWQHILKDPNEFLNILKVDLFAKDVFVFTPKGDVIELISSSTPIDFAFAVHTDIGMECIGAKINGKLTSLKAVLQSGDICKIIREKGHIPSSDWIDFVKTSKAKTKIRAVLRNVERERSKRIGQILLDRELMRIGKDIVSLRKDKIIENKLKDQKYKNYDDVILAIGHGRVEAKDIILKIFPELVDYKEETLKDENNKTSKNVIENKKSIGIKIDGANIFLVNFASCCLPIKGDSIIGFIVRGEGINIHRSNCSKILVLDYARKIHVSWEGKIVSPRHIGIKVITEDREGMLADLSTVFTKAQVNISKANCYTVLGGNAINIFKCLILDLKQLKKIVNMLESISGVHIVKRTGVNNI